MTTYKYEIWQIKDVENCDYAFMMWKYAKDKFSLSDYECRWVGIEGARDDIDLLEYLFEQFNLNHPEDFKGHSMSVSDVIKVYQDDGETVHYYYCDSFGWKLFCEAKLIK